MNPPFITSFVSDVDASNDAAGIHCVPIADGLERLALRTARALYRLSKL